MPLTFILKASLGMEFFVLNFRDVVSLSLVGVFSSDNKLAIIPVIDPLYNVSLFQLLLRFVFNLIFLGMDVLCLFCFGFIDLLLPMG